MNVVKPEMRERTMHGSSNVNIGIRQICEKVLKLKKEDYYSGYTFRHTWATVAQNESHSS